MDMLMYKMLKEYAFYLLVFSCIRSLPYSSFEFYNNSQHFFYGHLPGVSSAD